MTDSNATLKPCPFCGAFAQVLDFERLDGSCFYEIQCSGKNCVANPRTKGFRTFEEAIEAWNTRAAYETDDYFYLPKPKEKIADVSEPIITPIENGVRASCGINVYEEAVRKWQRQIERDSEREIIERICEVFKPERTCHRVLDSELASKPGWHIKHRCSECGEKLNSVNYCPNCSAKMVGICKRQRTNDKKS